MDDLLTLKQVCRLFNDVAPITVRKWREQKGFPFVIIPGDVLNAVRYDKAEVAEWGRTHGKRMRLKKRKKMVRR